MVNKTMVMRKMNVLIMVIGLALGSSCGSGDTGEGYSTGDRSGLNPEAGALDSTVAAEAGMRGNPANTIGGDTILNAQGREIEAPAPDSNATNPNIR